MEQLGQPDSPDPSEQDDPVHDEILNNHFVTATDDSPDLHGDLNHLDNALEEPISKKTEAPVDFLRGLTGSELTPAVEALLKQMLEKKNRKDSMVTQIKTLMTWDSLNKELQSCFPDTFLDSLADWVINVMQSEVIRQAILDQNRKEHEYYKKRENVVHDQQREIVLIKKRHEEALKSCDMLNTPHRKPIISKSNEEELHKLVQKQEEELYSFDRKIVQAIDNLLNSQQKKFRDIGIPGMKETTVSNEILQQMVVIDVIARLAGVDSQVI